MNLIKLLLIATVLLAAAPTMSQTDATGERASNRTALKLGLYPPDLIMRHQRRLNITDEQRSVITSAVKGFQSEVAELQWNMQNEQQELMQLLSGRPVADTEALQQAEQVLGMENQFKLAHFRLLIAIKNELTDEQISMLNRVIRQMRQRNQQS